MKELSEMSLLDLVDDEIYRALEFLYPFKSQDFPMVGHSPLPPCSGPTVQPGCGDRDPALCGLEIVGIQPLSPRCLARTRISTQVTIKPSSEFNIESHRKIEGGGIMNLFSLRGNGRVLCEG